MKKLIIILTAIFLLVPSMCLSEELPPVGVGIPVTKKNTPIHWKYCEDYGQLLKKTFEEKSKNLTPGFLHLDLTVFPIFQAWPAFQKEQTQNHFFLENNSNCLEKPSIFLESKIVTIQIEETVFVQDNPWFEKPLLEKNCEPPNRTSCHPWPKAGEKQAPSLRRVWCRRLTPRDQSPGRAV